MWLLFHSAKSHRTTSHQESKQWTTHSPPHPLFLLFPFGDAVPPAPRTLRGCLPHLCLFLGGLQPWMMPETQGLAATGGTPTSLLTGKYPFVRDHHQVPTGRLCPVPESHMDSVRTPTPSFPLRLFFSESSDAGLWTLAQGPHFLEDVAPLLSDTHACTHACAPPHTCNHTHVHTHAHTMHTRVHTRATPHTHPHMCTLLCRGPPSLPWTTEVTAGAAHGLDGCALHLPPTHCTALGKSLSHSGSWVPRL